MYGALLLKASERKFRCLDASSPIPFHRPSSHPFRWDRSCFGPPASPRHGKVGINVNRMSARSRRKALQYRIKESKFYLRSSPWIVDCKYFPFKHLHEGSSSNNTFNSETILHLQFLFPRINYFYFIVYVFLNTKNNWYARSFRNREQMVCKLCTMREKSVAPAGVW